MFTLLTFSNWEIYYAAELGFPDSDSQILRIEKKIVGSCIIADNDDLQPIITPKFSLQPLILGVTLIVLLLVLPDSRDQTPLINLTTLQITAKNRQAGF